MCVSEHEHEPELEFVFITLSVLPFSKLNKLFFGYFDPENNLLDNENK